MIENPPNTLPRDFSGLFGRDKEIEETLDTILEKKNGFESGCNFFF